MAIHARLAHMGIYVQDRDRMERFYTEVLGLMVTDHGEGRAGMHLTFMSGNPQNHHQLVLVTGRPDTSGFNPIQQMSFMVDSLADLREVHKRALALGATEMRPVSHGNAWSIYFKDPEGNTVEAYLDTPFHVPQPHGEFLDLAKTDAEILRETEDVVPQGRGLHADRAVQAARWRRGWVPEAVTPPPLALTRRLRETGCRC